ncbi:inositol monophosphatase family protein [Enterovibrio paralichthyis]|uniref:inositol monophosphatase family protein n=1 Tax=Enterovibrio paralichthyis TaxID=2853805 RepID=UPI0006D1CA37|nr:inositol monophosphatase [Enterovibrio paralichthyis]MBV7296792.1 inositol monophosphatase [Enterovibrio paralichthyis]
MKGKSSNMVSKLQLFTLLNMSEQAVRECLSGIVREAAQQAVVPSFKHLNGDIDVSFKSNNDIVTEADVDMQQRINDALNEIWPDIPVLGEEQAAAVQQAILQTGSGAFWVLDPIDGTSNFAFGIPYFCTSLSLVYEHQVQLGLVYDPIRDECFFATRQGGASLNGEILDSTALNVPAKLENVMALVDFKRLSPVLATALASTPPYRSQRSFGASALDWCWIAANRCQLYLHGGQKLWDYSAGWLILKEAGGESSSFDGTPVFKPALASRNVLAASHPVLFKQWQQWLSPFVTSKTGQNSGVRIFDPG